MISRFSSGIFLLPVVLSLVKTIVWTSAASVAIRQEFNIESESLLALVSQHLHKTSNYTNPEELFVPEAFRFLELDLNNIYRRQVLERNRAVLKFLNQPNASFLRTGVQEFDVSYLVPLGDLYPEIEKLLQSLDNVKIIRLKLEAPISATTLRHLERNNPSAQIYYRVPFDKQRDDASIMEWLPGFDRGAMCPGPTPSKVAALQSIINSTNLYSLEARVTYGAFTNRDRLHLVFEALSTCPNIRELDLSISKRHSLCTMCNGQPNYFNFRSNPNAKFPALEVLKLRGYNLDSTSNAEWDDIRPEDFGDEEEGHVEPPRAIWSAPQQV